MQFQLSPTPHQRRIRRIPTITLQTMKHIRGNCMRNSEGGGAWRGTPEPQAPPVWRAPKRPAAVPVGGGGAWPGFETTRRAKLAARTARGRAAAHGHNQQPGPTGVEGAGGTGGHGRASRSTTPSEARVWRSRGRAAAHQHTQRPGPQNGTRGSPPGPPRVHATSSHSAQSRARALSATEQPPPRRPGPR